MGDDTFYQQQEGYPIQYKMEMLQCLCSHFRTNNQPESLTTLGHVPRTLGTIVPKNQNTMALWLELRNRCIKIT